MIHGQIDYCQGRYIAGWAMSETRRDHCTITVRNPSGQAMASVIADEPRKELASIGHGRFDFGFRIGVPGPALTGPVRVFADDVELPGSPLFLGDGIFDGKIVIDRGIVSGWVSNRQPASTTVSVDLYDQDGCLVATVPTTLDPVADDPLFRPARFSAQLPAGCFGRAEIHLMAKVEEVAFASASAAVRLEGYLDALSETKCAGWLFSPDAPDRQFRIAVYRDGVLAASGDNDLERNDVSAHYPGVDRCGFDLVLDAPRDPPRGLAHISIRLTGSDRELLGGPFLIGSRARAMQGLYQAASHAYRSAGSQTDATDAGSGSGLDALARDALTRDALGGWLRGARGVAGDIRVKTRPLQPPARTGRRLSIVIPVYTDVEATRTCLESVVRVRRPDSDALVIVNDNPGDASIATLVDAQLRHPNVFILRNARNEGFIGAVNRAMDFVRTGDILLLNSDTELYQGALDELHGVLHAEPDIGTVTALSNNATLYSYPHPTLIEQQLDDIAWPDLAQAALRANAGKTVDIPTAHGFCMLIRRAVVDEIGLLDTSFGRGYGEENDYSLRAADRGWRHVVAGGVLVRHVEAVSFGDKKQALVQENLRILAQRYPEYGERIQLFQTQDDMRTLRWPLDMHRLRHCLAAGTRLELVIENGMDGGTQFAASDIDSVVRTPDMRTLRLTGTADGSLNLRLDGLQMLAVFRPEEAGVLFAMLASLSPDRIVVHHLLGFDQVFVQHLHDFIDGRHSLFHVHDFYYACPRVTLIDATGEFCGGAAAARCDRCLAMNGAHHADRLQPLSADAHRAMFQGVLAQATHVIAPSDDAAERLAALLPGIRPAAVPHPQTGTTFPIGIRRGTRDDICLLGAIGPHKGSAYLLALARHARLNDPSMRFHVIGYTNIDKALLAVGNVTISGRYDRDTLPDLVEATQSRIALFLHGWPETFSYTLTEAVGLGLIPVVPDIGAPAERVRASGLGVVFPFPIEIGQVMQVLRGVGDGSVGYSQDGALPLGFDTSDSPPRLRALYQGEGATPVVRPAGRPKRRRAGGP